jgi:hypothetical protein
MKVSTLFLMFLVIATMTMVSCVRNVKRTTGLVTYSEKAQYIKENVEDGKIIKVHIRKKGKSKRINLNFIIKTSTDYDEKGLLIIIKEKRTGIEEFYYDTLSNGECNDPMLIIGDNYVSVFNSDFSGYSRQKIYERILKTIYKYH